MSVPSGPYTYNLAKLIPSFVILMRFNESFSKMLPKGLYKQENADLLISDDNNLRKKKEIINAKILGSLGVILKLRKEKKLDKNKFVNSIDKMREIGWFSNAILDKVLMEGEKYG